MANEGGLINWYYEIPIISRCYLTAAILTSAACFLDLVSPLTLYFNYDLILYKGQYWRILSSFVFFGTFGLDFIFHMYFVMRYTKLLEEGLFRNRPADYFLMIIFGASLMLFFAVVVDKFAQIKFLGHPLTFMMVYIWSKDIDNSHIMMSFLGVFQFTAPYLPWVLISFSLLIGNNIEIDLLGICVGHLYYFLDTIYPQIAEIRGWSLKKILVTPYFLHYLFNDHIPPNLNFRVHQ